MVAQFPNQSAIASPKESFESSSDHFQSFQGFKDFIRDSFVNGSGVDPELFDACVEFHHDIETAYPGDDWEAPIHESLGWDYKRFRQQANATLYAAFFKNEDGSIWQAIVSLWDTERKRPYRYVAPKGKGDRAFLPPIPRSIWQKIAKKYGWDIIPDSGSFWEWLRLMDIPRILTEGGKKSLAALSIGYVAIAVFGCECGVKEDYLIDDLSPIATPETTWLIGFDADSKRKAQMAVARGRKKLTQALKNHSCYVAPMTWDAAIGKGLDDLLTREAKLLIRLMVARSPRSTNLKSANQGKSLRATSKRLTT
jgi:putative DNA primase/helicase